MSYYDILLAKNLSGGGGGDITVESLSVTANGTYTAPSGKAYSPVGVNVPNSYTASDEGKVVSSGALVAQTSQTIDSNGTYDTTLKNEVVVNVSGGGGGLEYETGIYIPSEDIKNPTINFANVHSKAPAYILFYDNMETNHVANYTNYYFAYIDVYQIGGEGFSYSSTKKHYGAAYFVSRTTDIAKTTTGSWLFTVNSTDPDTTSATSPRHYATETGFTPAQPTAGDQRVWRSTRQYKWIAIWAPTS